MIKIPKQKLKMLKTFYVLTRLNKESTPSLNPQEIQKSTWQKLMKLHSLLISKGQ